MRLLNTASLQLKDFIGSNIPPYAILSHTWGDEEVLFDDIQKGTATSKRGYAKVKGCCQKAAEDDFGWAWIDTCCIDKSSSAELSEAINSMYEWYKSSTICYVYLQDVTTSLPNYLNNSSTKFDNIKRIRYESIKAMGHKTLRESEIRRLERDMAANSHTPFQSIFRPQDFSKSRWFTRGWTLQELIAPKVVEFYTAEWVEIGTKGSLPTQLSAITGIPARILCGGSPSTCSIAERMSWASKRQTSREEDLAYSLLGLFGVNMPLLYGEGRKSFFRLQEEIMKQEEDYSIFAWSLQYDCAQSLTGLLAFSPADFSKTVPSGLQLPTRSSTTDTIDSLFRVSDVDGTFDSLFRVPEYSNSQANFYRSGYRYQILYGKTYELLHSYIPHRHFSASGTTPSQDQIFTPTPREPPELTSRGLRVSLPLMKSKNPKMPSVAWIYCQIEGRLLCILLRQSNSSSQLLGRHSASWLISVDQSLLQEFVLTELYLHPSGTFGESMSNLDPTTYSLNPWGRIKVKLPDTTDNYMTRVVSAYPYQSWSLDEFFFRGEPPVIGVLLFECVHDQQPNRFVIVVGVYKGHPWCEILEDLDHEENTLEALFLQKSEVSDPEMLAGKSDRSAVSASPGLIFSAAMRKCPAMGEHIAAFALRVYACAAGQPDIWISLYMSERQSLAAN
jgi:hypothetical protein